jgi:hypothetical protein
MRSAVLAQMDATHLLSRGHVYDRYGVARAFVVGNETLFSVGRHSDFMRSAAGRGFGDFFQRGNVHEGERVVGFVADEEESLFRSGELSVHGQQKKGKDEIFHIALL